MEDQEITRLNARLALFKEHWANIQDLLDDGSGYTTLTLFKDRLLDRRSELEPDLKRASDRAAYLELLTRTHIEEATRPHEQSEGNAEALIDSDTFDELADRPIGEQFTSVVDGKVVPDADTPKGWAVASISPNEKDNPNEANKLNLHWIKVSYRPTKATVSAAAIDSSSLRPQDRFTFSGDTTWGEAISTLRQRLAEYNTERQRYARTDDLLKFRIAMADIALYRFEVMGEVQLPNRDAIVSILGLELPSDVFDGHPKLRRHAEHIVQKYQDNPRALPSKTGKFHGWLGSWKDESGDIIQGESAAKSLQRLLNKHDMAPGSEAGYEIGNPESFCNLLEQLLLVDANG